MYKTEIPTPEEAIKFLKKYRPKGPWQLSAICPVKDKIETATFDLEDIEELFRWLEERIGKKNIYFNVNQSSGPKNKKSKKNNISKIDALHIDLDPDVKMPFEEERKRLTKVIESMNPKPNIVVDSGGGFQCYWQLEVPINLSGGVPTVETIEGLTRALETKYGGDSCHDVSRIMRLPGTINLPNKKKLNCTSSGKVGFLSP